MDTKASVHDRYAGGPRDAAFSCIVDVGIAWRAASNASGDDRDLSFKSGYLLPRSERAGQQSAECLANNHAPPLESVIGPDFGKSVRSARSPYEAKLESIDKALGKQAEEEKAGPVDSKAPNQLNTSKAIKKMLQGKYLAIKPMFDNEKAVQDREQSPMVYVRTILFDGVDMNGPMAERTIAAWRVLADVMAARDAMPEVIATQDIFAAAFKETSSKREYMNAAREETMALVQAYVNAASPQTEDGRKAARKVIHDRVADITQLVQSFIADLNGMMKGNGVGATKALFLKDAGLYLGVLTGALSKDVPTSNSLDTVDVDNLYHHIAHLSTIVDLYQHHFARSEAETVLTGAPVAPVAPIAPVATRAPVAIPAPVATSAPVGPIASVTKTSGKAPAKRGKTPPRARPTSIGAPVPAPTPAAVPAPIPAAASSMSSTPMVPTASSIAGASEPPAPRRRARDTGDSVTNSLFENMFKSAPTDAADEEPASPTPSSGSEGPTSGPRTFRRQR